MERKKGSRVETNRWGGSPLRLAPVALYSQLHLHLDPESMCRYGGKKGFLWMWMLTNGLYTETNWNCLFPPLQVMISRCTPDTVVMVTSSHQAVCSALKLLRLPKAIIPSSPVEMAWCAMMWPSVFYPVWYGLAWPPASLNSLTDREGNHINLWGEFEKCKHTGHITKIQMSSAPSVKLVASPSVMALFGVALASVKVELYPI